MLQHPIPQNVTGYQFRLIGDMTLKQFFLLLASLLPAIFLYNTNLLAPIKWALILLSVFVGFASAFLPFEERTLDKWLIIFIRAIYRPTHLLWGKSHTLPAYFTHIAPKNLSSADDAAAQAAAAISRRREGLSSYLESLPQHLTLSKLEAVESQSINSINNLFTSLPVPQTPTVSFTKPEPAPSPAIVIPDPIPASRPPTPSNPAPQSTSIGITPLAPVTITPSPKTPPSVNQTPAIRPNPPQTIYVAQPRSNQPVIPRAPVTSTETPNNHPGPTPNSPTIPNPQPPNVISGIVTDFSGKLVDGALIEIRDSNHIPVRATKTNKLGQFFGSTPLKNGRYEIIVDKTGLSFTPLSLDAKGTTIPPLTLAAKPS